MSKWIRKITYLLLVSAFIAPTASALADDDCEIEQNILLTDLPRDAPRFQDFPTKDAFSGRPAKPQVNSSPKSHMFRTRIRSGAVEGPNFAGHYTIAWWGCGFACREAVIIDAKSGAVYFPDNLGAISNYHVDDSVVDSPLGPIQYRKDSRLLVVIGAIDGDDTRDGISYFTWNDGHLKRIRFIPRTDIVKQHQKAKVCAQ